MAQHAEGFFDNRERFRDADMATRAVRVGLDPDKETGSVVPPIYQTSTYVQDGIGHGRHGYEYGRMSNPTRDALQVSLASLENGAAALSFSSGLAAEDALLRTLLKPGDTVVSGNDVYGGTHRLIAKIWGEWGVHSVETDLSDVDLARGVIEEAQPRVVWIETPTNPMMQISDVAALAEIAHQSGALVVVDNTFASPVLQQPISLGADFVVHSTTKYLGGHSDVVGGAVVLATDEYEDRLWFSQYALGAISSPFDCWLTLRGIKTLGVRVQRHSENAQQLAEWLSSHPKIEQAFYPGLPSHPGHDVAAKQMHGGFGGMVSVAVAGGEQAARTFAESTKLFVLGESLGGVESLINYPSEMTHASVKGTPLAVPLNVVRLSVGIEGVDDLQADLSQALDQI